MEQVRVMHYLNQFFAGMGGEEKADAPVGSFEGPVGPGKRLQALCGDVVKIVVTAYCGDNYFVEHHDEALQKILHIAREQAVEMVVAGPAFAAGRYGFACSEVCHFLSTSAGLYGVTGMYAENPGVDGYRQYKDGRVWLLQTSDTASRMEEALSKMAKFVSKLASGSGIRSASEEGYVSRGFRLDETVSKSGTERAIDMLLDKIAGRSFATEIPLESFEQVPVAPRIANLRDAHVALVATGGIVPQGNPDKFKTFRNAQWRKYSIDKLDSMENANWDVIHGGYNTIFMYNNPNYGVPLDVCRQLEREGAFGRLYPYFYATTGVQALMSTMQVIGKEMALDMKTEGVDAALLVST